MAHSKTFPAQIDAFQDVTNGNGTPGSATIVGEDPVNDIFEEIEKMQTEYGRYPMSLEAFAEDTEHTQGLVWGYLGGKIRKDNTVRTIAAGTVNLTDNTTNYVYYDWADNAVEANTTGFPSGDYLPIATIVTLNAAISSTWASRDMRAILQLGATGGASAHSDLSNLAYADAGHTGFEPAVTKGDLITSSVTGKAAVLTVVGGTGSVIGSGVTIQTNKADTDHDGYLSSADWDTFNGKQAALGYTAENSANKATSTSLGTSDTLYPTQNAVKSYVDAKSGGYSYPMDFRPTLESGVPVSITAQTAKTTLYLTPYTGNQIALYYNSAWVIYSVAEMSISLAGLTASTPYDIFCYSNSGTPTLELLAWTNATTRATALARQDGVLCKSGATTRRYIGTIFINSSGGQTDDSESKRFVWSYYNRVARELKGTISTSSWSYSTAAWRSSGGASTNKLDFVIGVREDVVSVVLSQKISVYALIAIGLDSVDFATSVNGSGPTGGDGTVTVPYNASHLGYHYLQSIEYAVTGTITCYGGSNYALTGIIFC